MPTLADLRVRFGTPQRSTAAPAGGDEALVADSRSKLSPAQMVEQKLRLALHAGRTVAKTLSAGRSKTAAH